MDAEFADHYNNTLLEWSKYYYFYYWANVFYGPDFLVLMTYKGKAIEKLGEQGKYLCLF